jgi:hypothetical protein
MRGQSIDQARRGIEIEPLAAVLRNSRRKGKSRCDRFIYCDGCKKTVPRTVRHGKVDWPHVCFGRVCGHCGAYETARHLCTIQKPRYDPPENHEYAFLDTECHVDGVHEPYLLRLHLGLGDKDGVLGGYNWRGAWVGERLGDYNEDGQRVKFFFYSNDEFVDWLVARYESDDRKIGSLSILAHNGSGYDWPVLYSALASRAALHPVRPVYRGSSLVTLRAGRGKRAIKFLDSMLFAQARLAEYPKMFGLTKQLEEAGYGGDKEFFPHWLGDETYRGAFPEREHFRPNEILDTDRRQHFDKWYAAESQKFEGKDWDFMEQAKDYCDTDVQILRLAMRSFRTLFMKLTEDEKGVGVDPLHFATLPGAVFGAYRLRFMPKDSIANLAVPVDRVLRRALYGGRTDALVFHHDWAGDDSKLLKYYDFNSLYPTVMIKYPYPRGHPRYYGDSKTWPESCVRLEGPAELKDLGEYLKDGTMAILQVDLLCPKTLVHPALGEKTRRPGDPSKKLIFSLDDKLQYWTNSVELRAALGVGYKVTAVHAVAHWPAEQVAPPTGPGSLWASWFRKFMPLKDSKGGYPKICLTAEEKAAFRAAYKAWPLNQGVELSDEDFENNPGLKLVAKLFCNTLWGKCTQRTDLLQTKVFTASNLNEYFSLIFSDEYEIHRVVPIKRADDGLCMEVVYGRPESWFDGAADVDLHSDCARESTPHAVHIGVFVTAYARMELWRAMCKTMPAPHAVKYVDTDSLVVEAGAADNLATLVGPFLGQLKDELDGDVIEKWACAAPKVYCYVTRKGKTKSASKGFRRNALRVILQQKFVRASVLAHGLGKPPPVPQLIACRRIARDRSKQEVRSAQMVRQFRLVASKVHLFADGTSLPFGHASIASRAAWFNEEKSLWESKLREAERELSLLPEARAAEPRRQRLQKAEETKRQKQRDRDEARLLKERDAWLRQQERERDDSFFDSNLDESEEGQRNEWMNFSDD